MIARRPAGRARLLGILALGAGALAGCGLREEDPARRVEDNLAAGRLQEACRIAREAVREHPQRGDLQLLLARACLLTWRTKEGVEAATEAVELLPEDPRAHLVKALLEQRRRRNRAALKAAKEALRLAPDDPHCRLAYGELLLGGGMVGTPDYDEAAEQFREVLRLDPENSRARFGLGKTLILSGRDREGAAEMDLFLASHGDFGEARYLRGLVRLRARDLAAAEEDFRRAILLSPELPGPLFNLARVLQMTGRGKEARATRERYEAALARDRQIQDYSFTSHSTEGSPALAMDLARLLVEAGRTRDALSLLESFCADRPSLPMARLLLAEVALAADRLGPARTAIDEALELVPTNARAHCLRSRITSVTEGPEAAIPAAREACRLDRGNAEYRILLGELLCDAGRCEEAMKVFQEARGLTSRSPRVTAGLGRALLEAGFPAEAERALTTAIARRPRNFEWIHRRGLARLAQGKTGRAEDDFRLAIALGPLFPPPYRELEKILRERGRREEAGEMKSRHREAIRREEAIRDLREKLWSGPEDRGTLRRLADLLETAGLEEDATRTRARAAEFGVEP